MSIAFTAMMGITTLLSLSMLFYSVRYRGAEKSFYFLFLSLMTYLYIFGYLLETRSTTIGAAFVSVRMQYLGFPFILPTAYLFIHDLFGDKKSTARDIAVLFLVPTITVITMQLFPFVKLYYKNVELVTDNIISNVRITPGILYYVWTIYSYVVLFLILRLTVKTYLKSQGLRRRQAGFVFVGFMFPIIASFFYIFAPDFLKIDTTPIATSLTIAVLLYSARAQNLLNIVPVARARIIEVMEDAFIVCDADYNYLDANQSAKELFPCLQKMMISEKIENLDFLKVQGKIQMFKKDGNIEEIIRIDTAPIIFDERESFVYNIEHTLIQPSSMKSSLCIVLHDITEREKKSERLRQRATFDPLLKIYNRGAFFDLATEIFADPTTEKVGFALLMIDADHFKHVNDTCGHLCGDHVLTTLGQVIRINLYPDDLIGRYGGEEIVILIRDVNERTAYDIAEKVRKKVEQNEVIWEDTPVHVTVSVGVRYSKPGKQHQLEEMLIDADEALYRAKTTGRNRTILHEADVYETTIDPAAII